MNIIILMTVFSWPVEKAVDKQPGSVLQWEGWFSFSGAKDINQRIVIRQCEPIIKFKIDENTRQSFCKIAGMINGRPDLCISTGLQTRKRCESIIEQNATSYFNNGEIIYLYLNDYSTIKMKDNELGK